MCAHAFSGWAWVGIKFVHRAASKIEYESAKRDFLLQTRPVGEFELKGIRRPLAAYNVVSASS